MSYPKRDESPLDFLLLSVLFGEQKPSRETLSEVEMHGDWMSHAQSLLGDLDQMAEVLGLPVEALNDRYCDRLEELLALGLVGPQPILDFEDAAAPTRGATILAFAPKRPKTVYAAYALAVAGAAAALFLWPQSSQQQVKNIGEQPLVVEVVQLRGPLLHESILAALRTKGAPLADCGHAQKATTTFVVLPDGIATSIEVQTSDANLVRCVRKTLRGVSFDFEAESTIVEMAMTWRGEASEK